MEFFLWFWLLDRRFCCFMRPLLKHFAFLWLIPIIFHLCIVALYAYSLYPFRNSFGYLEYFIASISFAKIISIICLFVMMINLYNISKNQPKQYKNKFVLNFEQIKVNSKDNKDVFIYYENYWMARKNLLSFNGCTILILSIIHIASSFYYIFNRNIFKDFFQLGERYVRIYACVNIFFCLPVVLLLLCATIIKVSFVVSAMCCTNCIVSLSNVCCKRNKGLKKTIDFSNIQVLEPEFV